MNKLATVSDVIKALHTITDGRVPLNLPELFSSENPFVVEKSSNIPGKSIMEIPGLVFGRLEQPIEKLAVLMTLTESAIELAAATGVNAIVAHHPIADAANSGGVTLKNYLSLYNISVFELHEAFHGLHPGISFLHGHQPYRVEISYGGIPGNIMYVGKALPEVKTLGDILKRLDTFMGMEQEHEMLRLERNVRDSLKIEETNIVTGGRIVLGSLESSVESILHIFPHTGYSSEHLEQVVKEHPEIDTVLASISCIPKLHPLVDKIKELGLNLIIGNSHSLEILENGLPLALALRYLLPQVDVVVFRERYTSTPLKEFGTPAIQEYANMIADNYLIKNERRK